MSRQLAVTLVVLVIVNVAAVTAAPLVERFASAGGQPGYASVLYPVITACAVLASSLLIVHERLAGRRPGWRAWLMLAGALAFTVWAAVAEVTR